jgi:hypothetical protein
VSNGAPQFPPPHQPGERVRSPAEAFLVGFDVGGEFLNLPGSPNLNAYLAIWRQSMDLSQQEARDLYDDGHIPFLIEIGALQTTFDEYSDLIEGQYLLPVDDAAWYLEIALNPVLDPPPVPPGDRP